MRELISSLAHPPAVIPAKAGTQRADGATNPFYPVHHQRKVGWLNAIAVLSALGPGFRRDDDGGLSDVNANQGASQWPAP